jgi:hypothetical protein
VVCDYRDRRGHPCPTAWCPAHVVVMGPWRLCRRHARIIQALAPHGLRSAVPAPDLSNRSPSLVAFLGEGLDRGVRDLLGEVVRAARGESLGEDALIAVVGRHGSRRWVQGWKVYDSTGPLLRVSVEVDEERDPEFALRLNGRAILRCVPPWIEARAAGLATPGDSGPTSPESFCAALVEQHLRPAVLDEDRWLRRWERAPGAVLAG